MFSFHFYKYVYNGLDNDYSPEFVFYIQKLNAYYLNYGLFEYCNINFDKFPDQALGMISDSLKELEEKEYCV